MILDSLFEAVDHLYAKIRSTQRENIIKAGSLIADAVEKGGAVHVFDTGHIIDHELIERGGGLMLLKPLKYNLQIDNPVRWRSKQGLDTSMEGLAEYVLKAANVLPGDVLILGSVSGKSAHIIDLALHARKMGLYTIVLTSMEYTTQVKSDHSSGKMLYELGDVVLDNCAPLGDAMMEVEGLEPKICAGSGLGSAYIMWAVTTVIIEKLMEKGIEPSIFKSHNNAGGPQYNENLRKIYAEKGI